MFYASTPLLKNPLTKTISGKSVAAVKLLKPSITSIAKLSPSEYEIFYTLTVSGLRVSFSVVHGGIRLPTTVLMESFTASPQGSQTGCFAISSSVTDSHRKTADGELSFTILCIMAKKPQYKHY